MLFNKATLERIAAGEVSLAFRRWDHPTVKAGGTLRTPVGVLAIDDVSPVAIGEIGTEDARRAGFPTLSALLEALRSRQTGRFYRIAFHLLGPDPRLALRQQDHLDSSELAAVGAQLDRLDRKGKQGAWTRKVLALIGANEGRAAADLAAELGWEKLMLKRRIRDLKALGLTESLQRGYRLSGRGRAVLGES
jgi:hypothetical protein